MRYEYYLKLWGGFFNDQYKKLHNIEQTDWWFDTKEERDKFISELRIKENKFNAKCLMCYEAEGFNTRTNVVCHRISEFEGVQVYSRWEMFPDSECEAAKYVLEYKFYPGFNDYPFGEDFDYMQEGFKVVSEWITGAFDYKREDNNFL